MRAKFDGNNYILRFSKGELLIEGLVNWAIQNEISGGWINGLGAALWAELGYYDLKKQVYIYKKINKILEIDSLQGNLAWFDGKPSVHLHATFSDSKMRTTGGHVKELAVAGTGEIFVHATFGPQLNRILDRESGLKLLDI